MSPDDVHSFDSLGPSAIKNNVPAGSPAAGLDKTDSLPKSAGIGTGARFDGALETQVTHQI